MEEVEEENEQHKSHIQSLIKQTPTKFKADHVSLSDGLSEKVFYLTEIVHFLNKENTRLKRVRYVEMGVRLMDEDDLMRVTKSRRLDIHKSSKTECALLVRDVHEALCRPKLIDLTSLYKSKIGRKSLLSRNMSKELEQSSLLARSRHLLESTLVQC